VTGKPWPAIPEALLEIWRRSRAIQRPEACLVNFYDDDARWACIRIATKRIWKRRSCRFRSATAACFVSAAPSADDRTLSFKLSSGDVVVLGGEGRLAFHGVDRSIPKHRRC
jgi:alkylated DNA repair protein (DNA oxidative demethylase)